VYNFLIKPFDKILFPVCDLNELREERSKGILPLNKITQLSDLSHPGWSAILQDMSPIFSVDSGSFHRKIWEFVHIVYVLKESGYLFPASQGLAIGAGREQILYYLAYKVKKITGIDLYEGHYHGYEDAPDIPEQPAKYAPFLYPRENLQFLRMNALDLKYPENSFDFILSASSIEHFGKIAAIEKSIQEMYRVLKPGAICVITTELKLNRLAGNLPDTRIFKLDELITLFKKNNFLIDDSSIDTRIENHLLNNWVKLPQEILKSPHVILRFLRTIFTSIALTFYKPGNQVQKGPWKGKTDFKLLNFKNDLKVNIDKTILQNNQTVEIKISLKNLSNFDWFTDGDSNRIAIGIKLLNANWEAIDHNFGQITIPQNIKKGGYFQFSVDYQLPTLNPGRYKLFFDIKRELMYWFADKGEKPFVIDIEII
jgi:SAM-dependent methyltransferase